MSGVELNLPTFRHLRSGDGNISILNGGFAKREKLPKGILPFAMAGSILFAACASSAPTPTPTEIARIQTPTPELTSSPTPEKKAEDSIPYYLVCSGGFSDPNTSRTGSILITFIPASGMKQGGISAIAFFVSSRNERNQIDEQQYVIPIKATGNNNFDGNRGFWDAKNIIIDPINKQVTGIIEGPPGNYNFQRLQCGGNGKAAFTAALTSMRSSIDPTKVFDALEKFGVNWSKWPN